ncbi:MAG: hypothetical protein GX115_07720 [Ruminiclostridium sp.]|nr:hypothetical protein [Ruminiclostridium sp.]
MNLKAALKYQLHESKKAVLIYYLQVVIIFLCIVALFYLVPGKNVLSGNINGFEVASMIFIFIAGLNSFRETFCLFIQNSISRRTMFISRMLSAAIMSVAMACIDRILMFFGKLLQPLNQSFSITSLFQMIYHNKAGYKTGSLLVLFSELIFTAFLYFAAWMFGYFITISFYRLNKYGKIAISVGVPVSLFIVLPILDELVFNEAIGLFFGKLLSFAFGFSNKANPLIGMITLLLISGILAAFVWLMTRRVSVKD